MSSIDLSAIPLTPAQVAAGVNPTIVHLASLCVRPGRTAPFTADEDNAFARAQLAFHSATGGTEAPAPRLYRLTPLLAPAPAPASSVSAPAQVASISADKARVAARAEAELLTMLEGEAASAAARKSSSARSKKKQSQQKITTAKALTEPMMTAAASSQSALTVEELSAARPVQLDEGDFRAEEWTTVSSSKTSRAARRTPSPHARPPPINAVPPPSPAPEATADEGTVSACVNFVVARSETVPEAVDEGSSRKQAAQVAQTGGTGRAGGSDGCDGDGGADRGEAEGAGAVCGDANGSGAVYGDANGSGAFRVEGESDTIESLREKLAELTAKLQQREARHEQELAAAHQAHQSALEGALRAAQEREGMRLQALQLRLYISDSRSRALEDALSQHIAAVGPLSGGQPGAAPTADDRADEADLSGEMTRAYALGLENARRKQTRSKYAATFERGEEAEERRSE